MPYAESEKNGFIYRIIGEEEAPFTLQPPKVFTLSRLVCVDSEGKGIKVDRKARSVWLMCTTSPKNNVNGVNFSLGDRLAWIAISIKKTHMWASWWKMEGIMLRLSAS